MMREFYLSFFIGGVELDLAQLALDQRDQPIKNKKQTQIWDNFASKT